jgi:hypothetical protein
MKNAKINALGALEITASENSSQNDFDFFVGKWQILNRKLKTRLDNCNEWIEFDATHDMHKILLGLGNTDNYLATFDGKPFEGRSLRLFNPATRLWSIYWADSNTGVLDPPVVGSFDHNIGTFYTKDTFKGKEIIVAFEWNKTEPNKPVWRQAFSQDNGATFEWNWYMYMTKVQ